MRNANDIVVIEERLRQPGIFRLFLAAVVVIEHSSRLFLGTWAVNVFFVLSGYWITRLFIGKYSHYRHPLAVFYRSRYVRLAPVFATCLALAVLYLRLSPSPLWLTRELLLVGSSLQTQPLAPAWSLDIEAQFYLVLPFLAYSAAAVPRAWRTQSLLVTGIAFLVLPLVTSIPHFILFHFLGFFFVGMGICYSSVTVSRRVAWSSFALFGASVVVIAAVPAWQGIVLSGTHAANSGMTAYNAAFSTVGSLFVVPFVCYSLQWKSSAFDRHLSNLAYPVYLFHWLPQLYFMEHYAHLTPRARLPYIAIQMLIVAAGSFAIYFLIDQPCERWRGRWLARQPKAS